MCMLISTIYHFDVLNNNKNLFKQLIVFYCIPKTVCFFLKIFLSNPNVTLYLCKSTYPDIPSKMDR